MNSRNTLRHSRSHEGIPVSQDQMARRKCAMVKRALTCKGRGRSHSHGEGSDLRWQSQPKKDKAPQCCTRHTRTCTQKSPCAKHSMVTNSDSAPTNKVCRWDSNANDKTAMALKRTTLRGDRRAASSEPPKLPCKQNSFEMARAG